MAMLTICQHSHVVPLGRQNLTKHQASFRNDIVDTKDEKR